MRFGKLLVALALLASISSRALASTIIVDVNGTGQFTDIPPAIAAAQDGDVIIVLQGSYTQFTLTKSLTILGVGFVTLGNNSTLGINGIPAGNRAVVANLYAAHLTMIGNAGHVVAQDIDSPSGPEITLDVAASADVRLRDLSVRGPAPFSLSRVELSRCSISGPNAPNGYGYNGERGVGSNGANRLHFTRCTLSGGSGGDSYNFPCSFGGYGAPAIQTAQQDMVIITGDLVRGGNGGDANSCGFPGYPCFYNGGGSYAVWVEAGATLRHSGTTFQGGWYQDPQTCAVVYAVEIAGPGTVAPVAAVDPTLELNGTPTAGGAVQFVVSAPVGSMVRLNFGRSPILVNDGLAFIEKLAPAARVVNLGVVPAAGVVTLNWNIPALPRGTFLVAQAEVVLQGGELRRTNSMPVVVR